VTEPEPEGSSAQCITRDPPWWL